MKRLLCRIFGHRWMLCGERGWYRTDAEPTEEQPLRVCHRCAAFELIHEDGTRTNEKTLLELDRRRAEPK